MEKIKECFNQRIRDLDKCLADRSSSIIDEILSKTQAVVDEINTKDRRIVMPGADFWLNRILNYILILAFVSLAAMELTIGLTSRLLWLVLSPACGSYVIIIVITYFVRQLQDE